MKRLLTIAALACCLACSVFAEQRVVWVFTESEGFGGLKINDTQLSALLKQGWRVTHVSITTRGTSYQFVTVFVLESPTKEAAK